MTHTCSRSPGAGVRASYSDRQGRGAPSSATSGQARRRRPFRRTALRAAADIPVRI